MQGDCFDKYSWACCAFASVATCTALLERSTYLSGLCIRLVIKSFQNGFATSNGFRP